MANRFASNPIVVRYKGKILGAIELDYDPSSKDFILEITDQNGQQIFKGSVDEDTLLAVDASAGVITLTYVEAESKRVLFQKHIDLAKKYGIQDIESGKAELGERDRSTYEILVEKVKDEMDSPQGTQEEIEHHTKMLQESTMSQEAREYVENKIRQIILRNFDLTSSEVESYTKRIYADLYGMGILQELDDDPEVGEIMVNAFTYPTFRSEIYYIKRGKKIKYDKSFRNLEEIRHVYSRAVAFSRKELNNLENAIVEATRANRDRVNVIIPDASESWVLNIRKFSNFLPNLDNMKSYGTVDDFIDKLMRVLVKGKANIGIGGEMGTGKTTFINYLLTYTDPIERKVVIASVNETDVDRVLKDHDIVILNVDETKGFRFEDLIRPALRTTASRIIVPESRGAEFKQVYEANLKTKGNMFTAHALDDYSFLDICVDMYNDGGSGDPKHLKNKIAKSLDIIVIMRKVGHHIRIKSISEVILDEQRNFKKMNLLYYWEHDPEDPMNVEKGRYVRTDNRLSEDLKARLNEYVSASELKDL